MSTSNSSFWPYLYMFCLLFLSGNPLMSLNTDYFIVAAVVFSTLDIMKFNGAGSRNILKYGVPIFAIYLIQALVIPEFQIRATFFMVLKIVIGIVLITDIGSSFAKKYVDVIWVLSIISLVGFTLTSIYGVLPGIRCAKEANSQIVYTQLVGTSLINRNAGMFWEPGTFAGYLNVALLFCVYDDRLNRKTIIPILLALITTFSTTGYIVLFCIILFYLVFVSKAATVKNIIFTIAVGVLAIYLFNNLSFLGDKINGENAEITNSRMYNYKDYKQVILDNIIIGTSYVDEGVHTGNGFLSFLSEVGIVGLLYYFISLISKLSKNIPNRLVFYLTIIFIIILQGECFLNYPFFIALPCLELKKSSC